MTKVSKFLRSLGVRSGSPTNSQPTTPGSTTNSPVSSEPSTPHDSSTSHVGYPFPLSALTFGFLPDRLSTSDIDETPLAKDIRTFHTIVLLLHRLQKKFLVADAAVPHPRPQHNSHQELIVLEALAAILVLENDVVAVVANQAYSSTLDVLAVSQLPIADNAATNDHSSASSYPCDPSLIPPTCRPPLTTRLYDIGLRFLVSFNPRTRISVRNTIPIIIEPEIPVNFKLNEWKALKGKEKKELSKKKEELLVDYVWGLRAGIKLGPHSWMVAELLMQENPAEILLHYVLSACHKKIHHRLTAGLSKSYLNTLFSLRDIDSSFQFQTSSYKRTLGQEDNDLLLFQLLGKLRLKSEIPKLMERAAKVPATSNPDDQIVVPLLYDKDTHIEFHRLLCELLECYKEAVAGLLTSRGDSNLGSEYFRVFLTRAKRFGYALQRVIKGSAISQHFEMLTPKLVDHRRQVVSTEAGIEETVNWEEGEVSDEDVEILETQGKSLSKSYVDWLALMVVHIDAVEVLAWYVTQGYNYNKHISIKHLVAPDTVFDLLPLEELFDDIQAFPMTIEGDPNSIPNSKLVPFLLNATLPSTEALHAITKFQEAIESSSWSILENCADNLAVDGYAGIPGWKEHVPAMQAVVKEVIKLKTQERDKLLDILDDKIDLCLRNAALFDRLNISDNTQVEGRLHCEAYLVSLLKRPDNLDASYAELMEQLKGYRRVIGISKRCCPVCYHLITAFTVGEEGSPFIIKGFHHTITPCALPTWLPAEIVRSMKEVFGRQLRKALVEVHRIYSRSDVITMRNRVPSSGSQAASLRSNERGLGRYISDLNDETPENPQLPI